VELPARGWEALAEAARGLDGRVRVAVLTGPWSRYADERSGPDGAVLPPLLRPPVTIAALAGEVTGGALTLGLAADLRVVEQGTVLAVGGDPAAAAALVPLMGRARALELALTGRPVTADEAVALGAALLVVPTGDLEAAAHGLAGALLLRPADEAAGLVAAVRRAGIPVV
jgi:hypothetical protein